MNNKNANDINLYIKEKDYNALIEYIRWCNELKSKNTELQDKIVITISTALFGIIMSALDKILLILKYYPIKILFITLIVFNCLTIILFLVSLKLANKALENDIERAYNKAIKRKRYYSGAERTQYAYLFCFILVSIIFSIIIGIVLYKGDIMKEENNKLHIVTESYLGASQPPSFSEFLKQDNQEINGTNLNVLQKQEVIDVKQDNPYEKSQQEPQK